MEKEDLKEHYRDYINNIPGFKSDSTYCTLISNIPFDNIKIVLEKWEVTKDSKGHCFKKIQGNIYKKEPCDTRTYDLWMYYNKNIKDKSFDYLQIIVDFINVNDIIYALTIADIVSGLVELSNRFYHEYNKAEKNNPIVFVKLKDRIQDCKSALRLLMEYLQLQKDYIQNVNTDCKLNSRLDEERKKIVKPLIFKIDGAMALAKEITVESFIKYAIDQCYFFEPKIVSIRMKYIEECFKGKYYIHTRNSISEEDANKTYKQVDDHLELNSFKDAVDVLNKLRVNYNLSKLTVNKKTKHGYFSDTDNLNSIKDYPIIIDGDGNKELRSVINSMTGYTIGAGKGNIFQNYRISHIWGRAYDPRFFTNLWNVVLVPAWANDLLDKPNPNKGSLESRLKSTIMAICKKLYFSKEIDWESIAIKEPIILNDKDIVKDSYSINLIREKKNKTFGDIVKGEPVQVP